jgi:hypothetical protein
MTALVGPTYSAVMAKQLVTLVIGSSAAVDDAKSEVERVLGAALTPRDSSYRGGAYWMGSTDRDGETIIVQRNAELEGPVEPAELPTIVYVAGNRAGLGTDRPARRRVVRRYPTRRLAPEGVAPYAAGTAGSGPVPILPVRSLLFARHHARLTREGSNATVNPSDTCEEEPWGDFDALCWPWLLRLSWRYR